MFELNLNYSKLSHRHLFILSSRILLKKLYCTVDCVIYKSEFENQRISRNQISRFKEFDCRRIDLSMWHYGRAFSTFLKQ
jgi:hypothetical protein